MRRLLPLLTLVVACSRPAPAPAERSAAAPGDPPASATATGSGTPPSSRSSSVASASSAAPAGSGSSATSPRAPTFSSAGVDAAVEGAIQRKEVPGAVVLVVHRGAVVHRKAYGSGALLPEPVAMREDAVFDLASLTKPMATATAIALLLDEGRIALSDPIGKHLPSLAKSDKGRITIEQLLLHVSGLPGDAIAPAAPSADAVAEIAAVPVTNEPGKAFVYSDLGYVLLGKLVEAVSGKGLDAFVQRAFMPLGMRETGFLPPPHLRDRAVPTEKRGGEWLRGEVHDPRAARMGGVAGHAGLFGTADDVAKLARFLLAGGELDGVRVLKRETLSEMLRPRSVPPKGLRAAGWDVDTGYSGNRGKKLGKDGFGHTGFTGTSLWIDRQTQTAIVVLSSRLHPDGKGDAKRLRADVADAVADEVRRPRIKNGIDVLEASGFATLRGHKVALLTHAAATTLTGATTKAALARASGVTLVSLFSPEHGLASTDDARVSDRRDEATGLPIHSLYGDTRKPTPEQLRGIDTVVVDLQDAGARFYTYASTLGLLLEAASAAHVRVVVLDRPNPTGGVRVEGPLLDAGKESFVGFHRIPIRHGMTLGELARLFVTERKLDVELEVVAMEGWKRAMLFEDTQLPWVRPSPNLATPTSALLYPGVALLETTSVSVGRGTDEPFSLVGAPWLDAAKLVALLRDEELPGVRFEQTSFTPRASTHVGRMCGGVRIVVVDPSAVDAVRIGIALGRALRQLGGSVWDVRKMGTLLGSDRTLAAIARGDATDDVVAGFSGDLEAFASRRAGVLLYPSE